MINFHEPQSYGSIFRKKGRGLPNAYVGAFIEFSPTVVKIDVFENKGETYRIPLKYEQSEGLRISLEI